MREMGQSVNQKSRIFWESASVKTETGEDEDIARKGKRGTGRRREVERAVRRKRAGWNNIEGGAES